MHHSSHHLLIVPLQRLAMQQNIGTIDRIIRTVVGSTLIILALLNVIGWWGWLGIVPILSAVFRYTPVYGLLGISTDKKKSSSSSASSNSGSWGPVGNLAGCLCFDWLYSALFVCLVAAVYHSTTWIEILTPAAKPKSMTLWPGLMRPSVTAVCRARGIEAAAVLP